MRTDCRSKSPIRGTIRIRPDRPPSGLADVVHKVVLPTAEPLIEYRATDDYGLVEVGPDRRSRAAIDGSLGSAEAAGGSGGGSSCCADGELLRGHDPPRRSPRRASPLRPASPEAEPLTGRPLAAAGKFAAPLSPLKLAKGDRVKITLEVTDYRGENDAGPARGHDLSSEPLVLEISDESGVLAAISRGRRALRRAT